MIKVARTSGHVCRASAGTASGFLHACEVAVKRTLPVMKREQPFGPRLIQADKLHRGKHAQRPLSHVRLRFSYLCTFVPFRKRCSEVIDDGT